MITAAARIWSALSLGDLGMVISKHLFGGVPFQPTEAYDELEALQLSSEVLGLYVTLAGGFRGEFVLKLRTNLLGTGFQADSRLELAPLDSYLIQCLRNLPEITEVREF